MQKIKYSVLFLCVLLFTQCEVEYKDFKPSSGEADFTTFVALGDSYTAGYTDAALGLRGQESSFPNIIAEQLATVGSMGFTQPLVKSNGSVGSAGTGYLELKMVGQSLLPVPGAGDMAIFAEKVYDASAPIHNLGVPGAQSSHLLATVVPGEPLTYYSEANPFFGRFASSKTTSVVTDALALEPTFISLWIGGNDVLSYALEGGEAGQITTPAMFGSYMSIIAAQLFSGATNGVIANIPDIDALPFFSYILSDGFKPLLVVDGDAPGGMRQLQPGEKVLLSAAAALQTGAGQSLDKPLEAKYVLDAQELAAIKSATTAYNETIKSIANQYGLAFVDLNALMKKITSADGIILDGNKYSSTFVTGGVFSLDGIHATARGYAIIANEFIKAINKQYNANIPQTSINSYGTVTYP